MADTNTFVGGNLLSIKNQNGVFTDKYMDVQRVVRTEYKGDVLAYDEYEKVFEYVPIESSWVGEKHDNNIVIEYGIHDAKHPIYNFVCSPEHKVLKDISSWGEDEILTPAEDIKIGNNLVSNAHIYADTFGTIVKDDAHKKSILKVTGIRQINYPLTTYGIIISKTHLLVVNSIVVTDSAARHNAERDLYERLQVTIKESNP